jgi:hypothetical protein
MDARTHKDLERFRPLGRNTLLPLCLYYSCCGKVCVSCGSAMGTMGTASEVASPALL